ncbi:ankyrin repeat domain-containing protein SOWAHA [Fundulus diaphanus]
MDLTQESIVSLLVAEGGRVKKSELVGKFRSSVECVDPAQRDRNRELFKTFVNNVACVKEIDGARYVVLRKTYQHLLGGSQTTENSKDNGKQETSGEQKQSPHVQDGKPESSMDPGRSAVSKESPAHLSPIQLALQRSKCEEVRVKRVLNFGFNATERAEARVQSKPYGLPLRVPNPTRVEIHKIKANPDVPPQSQKTDTPRVKRKPSSMESHSPQLRRAARSSKVPEEPKDSRVSSVVPLEEAEHDWLVKCAAGHWSQVYGLLLGDCQLAEKKDFISGFTVLHWVAKCGNSKMLIKVMELSREGKVDVDINAKSHGGYTPLHIAALHDQEYIMAMLVGEFRADVSIRDNCGNRAYHYLHKGISKTVREMLKGPKAQEKDPLTQREEQDLLSDLSRGLHPFGRFLQPPVISLKKKPSQRSGVYSLSDDFGGEKQDSGFRRRVMSNASVC